MDAYYESIKLLLRAYQVLLPQECRVFEAEQLPSGAKIIAANHPNLTDTYYLPFLIKEPVHVLIAGALFDLPVIGWLVGGSGQIPVYAGRKEEAMQMACEYLRRGETVVVYPEAQWNTGNKPMKGKSGAVRMSLASAAPIIPLGIYVSECNTKTVRVSLLGQLHQARWQTGGRCYLELGSAWLPGDEIRADGSKPSVHELTAVLMEKIYAQVDRAMIASLSENHNYIGDGRGLAGDRFAPHGVRLG